MRWDVQEQGRFFYEMGETVRIKSKSVGQSMEALRLEPGMLCRIKLRLTSDAARRHPVSMAGEIKENVYLLDIPDLLAWFWFLESDLEPAGRQAALRLTWDVKDDRNPRIQITYARITEESAAEGDYAEHGWEDEEGESFLEPGESADDNSDDVVARAVEFLLSKGVFEASSSRFEPDVWYSSSEPDMVSGDTMDYSYHLVDFTPSEEQEIYKQVMRHP